MDVVVLFNGLGNQMSQYAFYLKKKSINRSTCCIPFCKDHNGLELNQVFPIHFDLNFGNRLLYILFRILLTKKFKVLKRMIKSLFIGEIVKENFNYNFNKGYLLPSSGITFYYGGWHSPQYFESIRDQLLVEFKFSEPKDQENIFHLNKITATNSVALHVRRGDYLNADNLNLFGGVCTKEYFQKAISIMEERIVDPHFFIFSNDFPWVMENLFLKNATYVTNNLGRNSWKDMFLMKSCKNIIISNSTFSWWAAWLNTNHDKLVISPTRFLNSDTSTDIYPEDWIKLDSY